MGINTWNSLETVNRAGRYLQGSLFVDAFFPNSQDPTVNGFIAVYSKYYQVNPGTLEVQTHDAANILLKALVKSNALNRSKLREAIIGLGKYSGISGDFFFSESGMKRSAYLLTIKGGAITELPT